MNAVDATSRGTETDTSVPPSLLCVVLDTNPHAWHLLSSSLPLSKALANLLVFLNAHLAINAANRVVVLGSHIDRAEWLYPTPSSANPVSAQNGHAREDDDDLEMSDDSRNPADAANKYRPFAAVERAITANLQTLIRTTSPTSLSSTPTTMIAGALTLALTYIAKLAASSPGTSQQTAQSSFNYSDPSSTAGGNDLSSNPNSTRNASGTTSRILVLSASADNSAQYIPTMNAIFAAQRLSIPIDILPLSPISSSTFLQQAADATGGLYLPCTTPTAHAGLLQYLMLAFLPDVSAREHLILPSQASGEGGGGVDFRAACFCHRRIVDVGYVCSICLSIFCEPVPEGTCLTCGSQLAVANYGAAPVVVPKQKKKKKKRPAAVEGSETPGSGAGTPVAV